MTLCSVLNGCRVHHSLTFDLRYELAGSSEDLHSVEQRVGVDDLTQHPKDLPQTLVSQGPSNLVLIWMMDPKAGR